MAARTRSIDALRGIVMVLMALDHARDFFVSSHSSPTNLATTTVPLFFTRWITHFCAPVFVLLAGTAAYLHAQKHGLTATRRFLWTRGLWLILLELTIVRFAWIPDPFYHFSVLQVIWALGWAMLALSALTYLPYRAIVGIGALIVLGHNVLDPLDHASLSHGAGAFWALLHQPHEFHFGSRSLYEAYPILPWIGVMALGFGMGKLFELEQAERKRRLIRLGLGAMLAFVVLRGSNIYGDPEPWSVQPRGALFTLMSFLNCAKYPPSLAYLLMTLGPALIVCSALERPLPQWLERIELFGRVPLFFYIAHLYLLRFTAAPIALLRFGKAALLPPPGHAGSPGFGLWAGYVAWLTAIALLYPACRWFARKKAERRYAWLAYL
ncbi:MAG TPA: heparan-alpha-glucosaminide N-acetyltransferase domain-containing protein [Polyangiaceae bacterium]|jgi:uncharacterized membrane protein